MSNHFRFLVWEIIDRHVVACGGDPDRVGVKEESSLHVLIRALSEDDDAQLWAENERLKAALIKVQEELHQARLAICHQAVAAAAGLACAPDKGHE